MAVRPLLVMLLSSLVLPAATLAAPSPSKPPAKTPASGHATATAATAPSTASKPASAEPDPSCLDPAQPYIGTYLRGRDAMIAAKKGKLRPQVKISTNCIGFDGSFKIKVTAAAQCLAAGDSIQLLSVGMPPQTCRIVKVEPQPPLTGAAPADTPHRKRKPLAAHASPSSAGSPPPSQE